MIDILDEIREKLMNIEVCIDELKGKILDVEDENDNLKEQLHNKETDAEGEATPNTGANN